MTRRKAWIPPLGLLLLAMSIIAILALLYYAAKTAQKPPQQPPQPPAITATIEATQGGRVLANGTATTTWTSTEPFTLTLEATPEKCHALDHWLVNGTRHPGERLTLTIAGNTTIKAVFQRLHYKFSAASNASWGLLAVNSSTASLPFEAELPCGSIVRLELLPGSNETHSLAPAGFIINDTSMPKTEAELRVQGDLSVVALYRAETHVLLIESNAPGARVLVDGAEVLLPARIQRPSPFTAHIQAPPLIRVNETLAWGSPEVQELGYRRGALTWVTVAAGNASVRVEGEKRVRVYYYPYYSAGSGAYIAPFDAEVRLEDSSVVVEPKRYYDFVIILPPDWTRARVRVEGSSGRCAVLRYIYGAEGGMYLEAVARVSAQQLGGCSPLTVEFEVVRNPPSARVLSYHCGGAQARVSEYYTSGPSWNYGEGNKQYLGRLLCLSAGYSEVRVRVEVSS